MTCWPRPTIWPGCLTSMPQHIYLGGHSTGGTLALLTAESEHALQGGVRIRRGIAHEPLSGLDSFPTRSWKTERESSLRSPIHWLDGISTPTWLIEGAERAGQPEELDDLCEQTRNAAVHCIRCQGSITSACSARCRA